MLCGLLILYYITVARYVNMKKFPLNICVFENSLCYIHLLWSLNNSQPLAIFHEIWLSKSNLLGQIYLTFSIEKPIIVYKCSYVLLINGQPISNPYFINRLFSSSCPSPVDKNEESDLSESSNTEDSDSDMANM